MFKHLSKRSLPLLLAAAAMSLAAPVRAQSEPVPAPVYDPQGRVIPYDAKPEAEGEASVAPAAAAKPAAKSRHAKHAKKAHKLRKPRAHAKAKAPKKKAATKTSRTTSKKAPARKSAKPRPR